MSTLTASNTVPQPIELVFKEADGVSIAMDVYIPERATKETPVPVLLWWHGKEEALRVVTAVDFISNRRRTHKGTNKMLL